MTAERPPVMADPTWRSRDEERERELRAFRVLDDRRRMEFVTEDSHGWQWLTVAASQNEPGCVAIQMGGCDPELLEAAQVAQLLRLLRSVQTGTVQYPRAPRPCRDCEQVEHTADSCEAAEWDPTVRESREAIPPAATLGRRTMAKPAPETENLVHAAEAVRGYLSRGPAFDGSVPWFSRYERGFRAGVRVAYQVIGEILEGAARPCSCPTNVQAWRETIPGTSVCWRCLGTMPPPPASGEVSS